MQDPRLEKCIDACMDCYRICIGTASNHCLDAGGEHVAPEHFRTMLVCSEFCRTAAHILLLGSPVHHQICALCARICKDCAESCRDLDGMQECVEACEYCASTCREMADEHPK